VWASVDYTHFWLKGQRISAPVATVIPGNTDLSASFAAGGIADPNARILFGQQTVDYAPSSGVQATVGVALSERWGLEMSGFYQSRVQRQSLANSAGDPGLGLPFQDFSGLFAPVGTNSAGIFAGRFGPDVVGGFVGIDTNTQLYGAEANAIAFGTDSATSRLDVLAGFRYLTLEDQLTIGAGVTSGGDGTTFDRFRTQNRFYGPQLGARYSRAFDQFVVRGEAKCALGVTRAENAITGQSILPTSIGGGMVNEGFYAVGTNIGTTTRNRFAVVPEVGLSMGYRLCDGVTFNVGYQFLYWSSVTRAGDQVDERYNVVYNPVFRTFTGPNPAEPRFPACIERTSDFWMHGVTAGVELRY
jgi:hypothetical protein